MALRLRHIHLPGLPSYSLASEIQELLRRRLLDFKDAPPDAARRTRPPPPTLLSFTPAPTYTLGRRQSISDLDAAEQHRLSQPLRIVSSVEHEPSEVSPEWTAQTKGRVQDGDTLELPPAVVESPRGGLTTYHGPRQVVMWPILDLKSAHHKQFSVRCYSRLLEDVTVATLKRRWGLEGFTTEDPGVWVWARPEPGKSSGMESPEAAKIAALGVHLRRHVSASGVAVNLDLPRWRVGDSPTARDLEENPWARIVACGLEGKRVTSVAAELEEEVQRRALADSIANQPVQQSQDVASTWARELATRLGLGPTGSTNPEHDELLDVLDEPVVSEMIRAVERKARS